MRQAIPNQLGVDYNVHITERVVSTVFRATVPCLQADALT